MSKKTVVDKSLEIPKHPLDIFLKESKLIGVRDNYLIEKNHLGIPEHTFKAEIYMWGANKAEVYSDVWRDLKRALGKALASEEKKEFESKAIEDFILELRKWTDLYSASTLYASDLLEYAEELKEKI